MLRTFREPTIVLRAYKLGEADRILVLLGRDSGQFRAVAKGVRRTSSKFGARLGSFNVVDLQCYRGRELHTVTQAETLSAYSAPLASRFDAFTNAKLVVEVAQKVTADQEGLPEEHHREQFDLLHGVLHALASGAQPPTLLASSYLLRMMTLQGWQAQLQDCSACGAAGPHERFAVTVGGAVCGDCAPSGSRSVSPGALGLAAALQLGDWQAAATYPPALWAQVADLAGAWVQWHLEQKLRSLQFATTAMEGA